MCALCVRCVCALCMCAVCALCVRCVCAVCALCVCAVYVRCVCALYVRCVCALCVLAVCALCVHCVCAVCARCVCLGALVTRLHVVGCGGGCQVWTFADPRCTLMLNSEGLPAYMSEADLEPVLTPLVGFEQLLLSDPICRLRNKACVAPPSHRRGDVRCAQRGAPSSHLAHLQAVAMTAHCVLDPV